MPALWREEMAERIEMRHIEAVIDHADLVDAA
jgi:hypothetical protein